MAGRSKDKVRCGARRKRDGLPCEAAALPNGRCKFHGGCSTGSKTPEGRAKQSATTKETNRRRVERWRAAIAEAVAAGLPPPPYIQQPKNPKPRVRPPLDPAAVSPDLPAVIGKIGAVSAMMAEAAMPGRDSAEDRAALVAYARTLSLPPPPENQPDNRIATALERCRTQVTATKRTPAHHAP